MSNPKSATNHETIVLPPPKDEALRFDVDRDLTFEARRVLPDATTRLRVHAGRYAYCAAAAVVFHQANGTPVRFDVETPPDGTPIASARIALDALERELLEAVVDVRRLRAAIDNEEVRRAALISTKGGPIES